MSARSTWIWSGASVVATSLFFWWVIRRALASYHSLQRSGIEGAAQNRQALIVSAWTTFYYRLLGTLVDYLIKLADFGKNLFYFPIGVDYRRFKKDFNSYDFSVTPWSTKQITNDAYLPFKWSYFLLCVLAVAIPVWVFKSVSTSFRMFYPDPNEILYFALGAGLVIYFCDVVVIRTLSVAVVRDGVQDLRPGFFANLGRLSGLLIFRFLVVLCTATILGFSVITPLIQSDLETTLRVKEVAKVFASPEYERYQRQRVQLARDIFHLDAKRFCTGFAFTGVQPGETFRYEVIHHEAILEGLPSLVAAQVDTVTPNVQRDNALAIAAPQNDIQCRQWIDPEEPVCRMRAVGSECPNASKLAKEVIVEAVRLFGWNRATQSYNLGNADKLKGLQGQLGFVTEGSWQAFETIVQELRESVSDAKRLSLPKPRHLQLCGPLGSWFGCDDKSQPRNDAEQLEPNLDINEVANVMVNKAMNLPSNLGFVLPIALITLFAVFELLILLYKSYGSYDVLENLNRVTLLEHSEYLKTGIAGRLLQADMNTRSEWGLSDHVFGIARASNDLIGAYTSTAIRGMLFSVLPILLLAIIIYQHFKTSPIFWFFNLLLSGVGSKS